MVEGPLEVGGPLVENVDSSKLVGEQPLRDGPLVVAVDSVEVKGPLVEDAGNKGFKIGMGP